MDNTASIIENHIGRGELKQALEILKSAAANIDSKRIQTEIVLLNSRFSENEQDNRNGVITGEIYTTKKTLISKSVLSITYDITENYGGFSYNDSNNNTIDPPSNNPPSSTTSPDSVGLRFTKENWWQWVLAFAVIVGILGNFADIGNFFGCGSSTSGDNSQLTVFVHGEKGKHDLDFKNLEQGRVIVDFGNSRTPVPIDVEGRANIGEIPSNFIGKRIPLSVKLQGFEMAYPDSSYIFRGEPIYVQMKPICSNCRVAGIVREGNQFKSGLIVSLSDLNLIDTTDNMGKFEFNISTDKSNIEYSASILKNDTILWRSYITPHLTVSTEIELKENKEYCLYCSAVDSYGKVVNEKEKCSPDVQFLKNYIRGFYKASREQGRKAKCTWNNRF